MKHPHHLLYCNKVNGEMVPTQRPTPASFEFYTTADGTRLMRKLVEQPEECAVVCLTRPSDVARFCRMNGCELPEATSRLLEQRKNVVAKRECGGPEPSRKAKQ